MENPSFAMNALREKSYAATSFVTSHTRWERMPILRAIFSLEAKHRPVAVRQAAPSDRLLRLEVPI